MTLTPHPSSEHPRQVDAGVARWIGDIAAQIAEDMMVQARDTHHHREYNLRCARLAIGIGIEARTYAALIEADDFREPGGAA